jgi:hypothetical protein
MIAAFLFDEYRDQETREQMVHHVVRTRRIEHAEALKELRSLNHVGLAYLYRDMLGASGQGHLIDYDASEYAQTR